MISKDRILRLRFLAKSRRADELVTHDDEPFPVAVPAGECIEIMELALKGLAAEKLEKACELYGNEQLWSPDKFMCGSEMMRSDLSETKWSRFTPGKMAREALAEYRKETEFKELP